MRVTLSSKEADNRVVTRMSPRDIRTFIIVFTGARHWVQKRLKSLTDHMQMRLKYFKIRRDRFR
jgi:hypothetical protein